MADSATWADDLRSSRPEASPWHYIDIPRDAPRSALAESCPGLYRVRDQRHRAANRVASQ